MSPAIAASLRKHGFDPEELANLALAIAQLNGERWELPDDQREEIEDYGAEMWHSALVAGLEYAGDRRAPRVRDRRALCAGT